MARKRTIAPGFFRNEELGECSPLARLLFAGLWCWADRLGRVEDRPKRLRAEILPYDPVDGEDLVAELAAHGFVKRYEAAGVRVLQIVNFKTHQDPHPREAQSTLPDEAGQYPVHGEAAPKADPGPTQGAPGEGPSPSSSLTLLLSSSLEAAAAPGPESPAPPVEAKPEPIRPIAIHLEMQCPDLAALLKQVAFGVEVGRYATTWGAAENLVKQLGPVVALELAADAAPRSDRYPDRVPLSFLNTVWLGATKRANAPRSAKGMQPPGTAKDFAVKPF